MPGKKNPGDDGYTKVNCLAAAAPMLLMTVFYALPRMAFDSFRARRRTRG